MSEWFRSVCQRLTPEDVALYSFICVVLALLVLGAIVLGFGPLRAWFGLTGELASDVDGLRDIWRLYREVGRARAPSSAFSGSDVSAPVVPDNMVEQPRPARDLAVRASP